MGENEAFAEEAFNRSLRLVCGLDGPALGGVALDDLTSPTPAGALAAALLRRAVGERLEPPAHPRAARLAQRADEAERVFVAHYAAGERQTFLRPRLQILRRDSDWRRITRAVAELWAPEIALADEEILARWVLSDLRPAARPPRPEEIVLQLNALYGAPLAVPDSAPARARALWRAAGGAPGERLADFDHPVPLFAPAAEHELVCCLAELDGDLAFEKERGVLPAGHRVPLVVSVSATHRGVEDAAAAWAAAEIRRLAPANLEIFLLTEEVCARARRELFGALGPRAEVFGVRGSYARHFNALKYAQLLLERARGVTAGFKLDTDEGLRSRELHAAVGRTWFETLCHPFWGGTARDPAGRECLLGINVGEYIAERDLEREGYARGRLCPEVRPPESPGGPWILLQKAEAHGRATVLFNRCRRLEEGFSHPVVKGGGYGITNEALRRQAPFAFSAVGRAEDQQFYFSGLARGLRGIFHPELRLAHYKSRVAGSEARAAATRALGDIERLVLFEPLAAWLGVKDELDPMPGVFASPLSRPKAVFSLLLQALAFAAGGREAEAAFLLGEGFGELDSLLADLDAGALRRRFDEETAAWRELAAAAGLAEAERALAVLAPESGGVL